MSASISETDVRELCRIAEQVVGMAKQAGADACEALVRAGNELTAKVRLGKPELVQEAGSRSLGLRVFVGARRATTYTSDFRPEALRAFCAESVALARFAEADDAALPPDPSELAKDCPDLELYDEGAAGLDAAWALAQATEAEAAALRFDARINNSEGATWSRSLGATALATSGGFCQGYRGSYVSLVVEPLCDDHSGETPKKRNGHWWTGSRFLSALESPRHVGETAARRTLATLGSRKIETGELPIVFDPDVARGLVGTVFSVANGSAFWRKSTYLVGQEGKQIASPLVTIIDDARLVRAPGSKPFDGDGLATRRNVVVANGVLETVLCDVYSARKLGRASTGSAARGIGGSPGPTSTNLFLQAGTSTPEQLISGVSRGLYVTHLMGFGFNAVTGDFSRGAQGFLIERGEKTTPVSEITISANFADILGRIDGVGNDLQLRSSTAAPTVRVSHMMVAGS